MWKLWLDDQMNDPETPARHVPPGYVGAESSQAAMDLVKSMGVPVHLNLDHDLGGEDTAKVFLKWLAGNYPDDCPSFEIHSANPAGVAWMESFLLSWKKSLTSDCGL